MKRDLHVTISGPQGAGKTTLLNIIHAKLRGIGLNALTSEPQGPSEALSIGDTPIYLNDTSDVPITHGERLNYRFPYRSAPERCFVRLVADDRVRIESADVDGVLRTAWLPIEEAARLMGRVVTPEEAERAHDSRARALPSGTAMQKLAESIHQDNVAAGWWSSLASGERIERNVGELLMLVVSEISEATTGLEGDLRDDKLPHRDMLEVELADAEIRLLDICGGLGLQLGGAWDDVYASDYLRRRFPADLAVETALLRIVGEISAAMEGDRKKSRDREFPHRTMIEARLASALMGIAYLGLQLGLDVPAARKEKREFNRHRADHKVENRQAPGGKAY